MIILAKTLIKYVWAGRLQIVKVGTIIVRIG